MRIKRTISTEAPDINLIPLIDVLLVIVIFLVVSTTFMQPSQLEVDLPGTQSAKEDTMPPEALRIRVGRDGNYALGAQTVLTETQLQVPMPRGRASKRRYFTLNPDGAKLISEVIIEVPGELANRKNRF